MNHQNTKTLRGKETFFQRRFLALLGVLVSWWFVSSAATPDYTEVDAIFSKHCLDCHESKEPEANLVLESFETLMKGGESGVAVVAGKCDESLLVRMIEGKAVKNGKQKIMPPGKRKKLMPEEIAAIKSWIDAGAKPPT